MRSPGGAAAREGSRSAGDAPDDRLVGRVVDETARALLLPHQDARWYGPLVADCLLRPGDDRTFRVVHDLGRVVLARNIRGLLRAPERDRDVFVLQAKVSDRRVKLRRLVLREGVLGDREALVVEAEVVPEAEHLGGVPVVGMIAGAVVGPALGLPSAVADTSLCLRLALRHPIASRRRSRAGVRKGHDDAEDHGELRGSGPADGRHRAPPSRIHWNWDLDRTPLR